MQERKTFTVTIKREGDRYVSRVADGEWHSYGSVAGYDPKIHGDQAHWLYHADEIASVNVINEHECTAELYQW